VWTEFSWLMTGSSGGLPKSLAISWPAGRLSVSQEGLGSMVLVGGIWPVVVLTSLSNEGF